MNTTTRLFSFCALFLAFSVSIAIGESPTATVVPRSPRASSKIEGLYSGPWVTTNPKKQLNGTTNCQVVQLSEGRWQARFWGEWQKVPFDYTVEFAGSKVQNAPPAVRRETAPGVHNARAYSVSGTALIDGASYEWTGVLSANEFTIQYGGSRYEGHLELARVRQ